MPSAAGCSTLGRGRASGATAEEGRAAGAIAARGAAAGCSCMAGGDDSNGAGDLVAAGIGVAELRAEVVGAERVERVDGTETSEQEAGVAVAERVARFAR